jgi:23S rRNA pseudouridine955/2504/2580 synthase
MLITVNNHALPIRLDRYIKLLYPHLTQGLIEKNLRLKNIRVNDCKAAAKDRVSNGFKITLPEGFHMVANEATQTFSSSVTIFAEKLLSTFLLFEHEQFYAINKPHNVAVQGGSNIKFSLDDCFKYLRQSGHDLRLVHRLDKDTSGVLLIARSREAAIILTQAFKDKLIKKTYIALVLQSSQPASCMGTISTKIDDKDALTHYNILKSHRDVSLMEFKPVTGRMHQIRKHVLEIGGSILGDSKYGSCEIFSPNLMLHASEVCLPKEIFGENIIIKAKPHQNFLDLLQKLLDTTYEANAE